MLAVTTGFHSLTHSPSLLIRPTPVGGLVWVREESALHSKPEGMSTTMPGSVLLPYLGEPGNPGK